MGDYERLTSELKDQGIKVIAASADSRTNAEGTADQLGLSYSVGYELPLQETAKRFGCFYEKRRSILHATGFLVRPTGSIAVSCYSSGAIGRLEPREVVKLVRFFKSKGQ